MTPSFLHLENDRATTNACEMFEDKIESLEDRNVNDIPTLMTELSQISNPRIRFFLTGDPEPTAWGRWLTAPVNGHLEHEVFGPFPAAQAERCQIMVDRESPQANDRLFEAGFVEVNDGLFEKVMSSRS